MNTVLEAVAVMTAARDQGDKKIDKERKAAIASLMKKASALASKIPSEDAYPEVMEAIKTVQAMSDLSMKLAQQAELLKVAPAATTEAVEAQKELDHTRRNIDAMLKPVSSTMETLEDLLDAAIEMEATYLELQKRLAGMQDSVKKERARLSSVANAINNAAKIA